MMTVMEQLLAKTEKSFRHALQPQETLDRRVLTGGFEGRPELALRQTVDDDVWTRQKSVRYGSVVPYTGCGKKLQTLF